MKDDLGNYLSDAIKRIEEGGVRSSSGSHIAGIFGKAANAFEKEVKAYVCRLLQVCGLDYDRDVRTLIRGPVLEKLTLGNCLAVISQASKLKPTLVSASVPGGWKLAGFHASLTKINDAWVQVKHGDEVAPTVLLTQMKSMLKLHQLTDTQQHLK